MSGAGTKSLEAEGKFAEPVVVYGIYSWLAQPRSRENPCTDVLVQYQVQHCLIVAVETRPVCDPASSLTNSFDSPPHQFDTNLLFTFRFSGDSIIMAVTRRSIREIDSAIDQYHHFLSGSHPSHPLRPTCVYGLVMTRLDRYELSNKEEPDTSDLDNLKAIFHLTESMLLHWQPRSFPEPKDISQFFSVLTLVLHERSEKHPEHATYVAKFLRHLRNQPHAASGFSRHVVTTSLVNVLVIQVKFEASSVLQKIEEMAVLCHELLTSDPFDDNTIISVTHFSKLVVSKICLPVPDQPLGQIIECLRLVRIQRPKLRRAHFALALCLRARYLTTLVNDDYEEITSILDEIITSSPPRR
ncbi:hypothetical protein H4582DRAFT_949358 [Lactarius indigo]|nr:hypothetical protein H4582DRAFT_949358 [Lactarius indigo]